MFEKSASMMVGLSPIMCSASKLSSRRGLGGITVALPPPLLEFPLPSAGIK
jgi:hypothetical protein